MHSAPISTDQRVVSLKQKIEKLHRILAGYKNSGRVGVAFSGGADSSFLLRSTLDVLGRENVIVLHGRSVLQKRSEQEGAANWLERHGYGAEVEQLIVEQNPLAQKNFVSNPQDRCYLCKSHLYQTFLKELSQQNLSLLLDGTNRDDLEADRPGYRAIRELAIKTPLAAAGLSKKEIRKASRSLGLDTWDLPSNSCLATRIPHGLQITAQRLGLVRDCEQVLARLGLKDCRVHLDSEQAETVYIHFLTY